MLHQELPRLSAHSLKLLDECPRLFALRYRLNRYWPALDPGLVRASRERRLDRGKRFHELVETHRLGLAVDAQLAAMEAETPGVAALWQQYLAAGLHELPAGTRVWTEQELHFRHAGAPFMVRFDRLVKAGGWTILDWKTGKVDPQQLRDDWQTRLYLFALVEAGEALGCGPVLPEQVRLIYWEVDQRRGHPIAHDAEQHAHYRELFAARAAAALRPFDPESPDDPAFPRRPERCPRCVYDSLCNAARPVMRREDPPLPRFAPPAGAPPEEA